VLGIGSAIRIKTVKASVGVSMSSAMTGAKSLAPATLGRADTIVMAMAAGGRGTLFEPVRIQKLLFLIDREIPHFVAGPHFDFQPYRYGPFDRAVYDELSLLSKTGKVDIRDGPGRRTYSLAGPGLTAGTTALRQLPVEVRLYLSDLARWVLSLSFGRLLAAIYQRYPEMSTKSVALDVADRFPGRGQGFPDRPFLEGMASTFDLTGSLLEPRTAETGARRDVAALLDDWRRVGDDLRSAMAEFATTSPDGS
jgi:hypothetical protein